MMFEYLGNSYFPNQIPKIKEPIGQYKDVVLYGRFRSGNTEYVVYEANNRVRYAKIFKNGKGEYFVYNVKRYRPEMFKEVKTR